VETSKKLKNIIKLDGVIKWSLIKIILVKPLGIDETKKESGINVYCKM